MAMDQSRDFEDARGEMDRLFAEMPCAPAALVLMVATRGRLGRVGPRDDPPRAADGARGALGAPGTPHLPPQGRFSHAIEGGPDERAGHVGGATPARTEDPHERRRTGTDPWSTASKR